MTSLTVSCMFWEIGCRVDWPAWVQAVGSVIGIFVAIIIAMHQTAKEKALREETSLARYKNQRDMIYIIIRGLMDEMERALNDNKKLIVRQIYPEEIKKIYDLIEFSKDLKFDTFDYNQMISYITIRTNALAFGKLSAKGHAVLSENFNTSVEALRSYESTMDKAN